VFASVANDGRIEIWDLKKNSLGPQLDHWDKTPEGEIVTTPKTVVKFSKTSPVILAGAIDGRVCVYRTYGLEHGPVSDEDQMHRIMSSIAKEDFSSTNKEKKDGDAAADH
jgi:WD40 repeat protein